MTTLADRLARLSTTTVVIWRRPWQDTQRKRKMHGVDVSPEQRARWQALDRIAATVLRERGVQP